MEFLSLIALCAARCGSKMEAATLHSLLEVGAAVSPAVKRERKDAEGHEGVRGRRWFLEPGWR
jgi:uncharacterized membrane protein